MDLFELNENLNKNSPLADRMRPKNLAEFFGQEHLIGRNQNGKNVDGKPASQGQPKILRQLIEQDQVPSMILWGPPGTGKTTLAKIIAELTKSNFVSLSAVSAGVSQLKEIVKQAMEQRKFHQQKTILFIDEIHRWNKTQQDSLLPYVENGTLVLIGATTENPSFEINSALLSRVRVFVLESLSVKDISKIIRSALKNKITGLGNFNLTRGLADSSTMVNLSDEKQKDRGGKTSDFFDPQNINKSISTKNNSSLKIKTRAIKYLANFSNGDARTALNNLELAVKTLSPGQTEITEEIICQALQKAHHLYDKSGDQHYHLISALHKSLRGSDANASLYWLMRMFVAGEDPLYIARRLVRFASEDVGLANSQALTQAIAGYQACQFLGRPECDVHLAQVVVYLAKCKKSNELYEAVGKIKSDIENFMDEPVPIHLRNAPTKFMKDIGYGKEYKYNPNFSEPVDQEYLPKRFKNRKWLKI